MNKPLCELSHIEALAELQAAETQIAWLTAQRGTAAGAPLPVAGLGRLTNEDDGFVTLQFIDEDAAQAFMQRYSPTVEVTEMPDMPAAAKAAPARRRARSLRRPDDAEALPLPPLYRAVMAEIDQLMAAGARGSLSADDEIVFAALVDVAMVYERTHLPGWLFPEANVNILKTYPCPICPGGTLIAQQPTPLHLHQCDECGAQIATQEDIEANDAQSTPHPHQKGATP